MITPKNQAETQVPLALGTNNPAGAANRINPIGKDMRKTSVRSGAITVTSQGVLFGVQLISTSILARLLMPSDFGLIAMVVSLTAFAQVFKDVGLSSATIQQGNITHGQINALFWLNIAAGGVLTLAIVGVAPVLAWFYHKPDLLWVTICLSTTFAIDSLGIQHSALLNREMRFGALAKAQVFSAIVGVIAAIAAAYLGARYWALVCKSIVTSLVTVVLLWFFSKWRPGRPKRADGVGSLFRFGANVTGFNIVNYFSRNFDNVLVGRICGAGALGLYSKAYGLLMLPISNLRGPLSLVAYPAMSQLKTDPVRYRNYFKKYMSVLGFASMPITAFLFVCSEDVINLLLGPRWEGAARIFRILALMGFIQPVASLNGLVMLSMGQSKRYFRWGAFNAALAVAAFGVGVIWGPVGVAAGGAIVSYVVLYPMLAYSFKGTQLRVRDFFVAIARPAVASIAAGAVAFVLRGEIASTHHLFALLLCGLAFVAVYLIAFAFLPGGRDHLREYFSHARLLLDGRMKKHRAASATSTE